MKMSKMIWILIVYQLAQSLAIEFRKTSFESRVVGGKRANITNWPFIASIQVFRKEQHSYQHFCGGVILDEVTILTAAHCFGGARVRKPRLLIVKLGSDDKRSPRGKQIRKWQRAERKNVYKVKKIIVHPGWIKSDWINDIAVLKLYRNITFGVNVSKARLEDPGHTPRDWLPCWVAGWGSINPDIENDPKYPNYLYEVNVPIRNLSECRNNYLLLSIKDLEPKIKRLSELKSQELISAVYSEMNICAGARGRDSCVADSGGPLTCEGAKVNGIVSWGGKYCGAFKYPGVYSHVSHFRYWIDKQMK